MAMTHARSKTPITDLDAPDGAVQNAENQQVFNNNNNNNSSNHSTTHNSNGINHNNNSNSINMKLERKMSIPTAQNKHLNSSNEDEKHSTAGDPIYHTISSEKGAKALGRNCISLENLRTLTIKNDLNSYGNNLLQNHNGQPNYYILPTFPPPPAPHHYFSHKPHPQFVYGPPFIQPQFVQPPFFHQNYRPFTNYGGYTNPNPYSNLSNTNSRQSVGNESDDYRKYRDVAL